jgi:ABC-2 type transport system permease protein
VRRGGNRLGLLTRPMQIGTFLRKEAVDVLHQPRLLLTLVIGPFLVMAVFGIGYRDSPTPMRTMFVAPEGSPFIDQVESYAEEIGTYVKYAGVTTDADMARRQLLDDKIDLIVSFPDEPLDTILGGERAPVTVVHTRLDPIEQTAISFASRISIDQINSQILAGIVGGGQDVAAPAGALTADIDAALDQLDAATGGGDPAAIDAAIADVDAITQRLAITADAAASLQENLGSDAAAVSDTALASVRDMRDSVARMSSEQSPDEIDAETVRLRELIGTVSDNYSQFTAVDPAVLVQPFRSEVSLAVADVNKVTDWYAPAAVVLMLQQFGVAFGALSFVRERQLGIVDVFRVAPVNAAEALIGKYLAYLAIGGAIGAVLTVLVVQVLEVPIAASVGEVAIVMALSLFASVGLGLVISLVSATDAQAVQYTMILLLASLFFSGFFLSSGQLEGVARYAGWLLPVTFGMKLLRDVMLRGAPLDTNAMIGLSVYGVVMFVLALIGTRRRMSIAR